MKITYSYNSEKENILQSDFPKLILNKNSYSNYDIPHILKEVFKTDKLISKDFMELEPNEREFLEKQISEIILKNWTQLENSVFFELEKLFYVFINFYSYTKNSLIITYFRSLLKLIYNPNSNIKTYFKNKKSMREFCYLYKINNSIDCLQKIFNIFNSIENFLSEMKEKINKLIVQNKIYEKILNEKIFSFDITIYSFYEIFRDFFDTKKDYDYLKSNLYECFKEKLEKYEKDFEKFNMKDIDKDQNEYLGLDYLKFKNKNVSDDVINIIFNSIPILFFKIQDFKIRFKNLN